MDNDLNEKIERYIKRAIEEKAIIYAFGERWGPEENTPDSYFHFEPGNGIHDIHMNQGNVEKWKVIMVYGKTEEYLFNLKRKKNGSVFSCLPIAVMVYG